jgi:hypothetical protein
MATVTPNFNWPVPTSTDLVKDGATAIEALGDSIDASLVDLKGGTTGQVLSKTSNTDMDFTWVAADDTNAIQNTIVDAKGDLIAASAADTPARLAVGNNGETLVADSSTSTGLRYQAVQTRNCVYNSQMEVWQRGTSFTAIGYVADRWYFSPNGALGRTVTRQAGTGQFQYVMRVARNSGDTDTMGTTLGQSFEIADSTPYAGKTVTVSFYARAGANYSGASSVLSCFIFSGTSATETNRITTAYPSGGTTVASLNATLTTTLQRFQFTFTFGAGVTQFCIDFEGGASGTAGAADYYEVTGVQLEVGSIATNYVRQGATIQGELAACRYYYKRNTAGSVYGIVLPTGSAPNSTTSVTGHFTDGPMRVAPTAVEYANICVDDGSAVLAISNVTNGNNTSVGVQTVFLTVSGATAYRPYRVAGNNNAAGYIAVSAEL